MMSWQHQVYYRLRDRLSKPHERGLASAGYLHGKIRDAVVELCAGDRGAFLEVGSGEGLLLAQLAERNPLLDITGVDLSEEQLRKAQELFNSRRIPHVRSVLGMAHKLPFPEHSFDVVACVNTTMCLRTLAEVRALVSEMARVAKVSGTLIMEYRNRSNLFLRLKYGLAKYYDATVADHPFQMFTQKQMAALLDEFGFRIESRVSLGKLFLGPCSIVVRAKRHD